MNRLDLDETCLEIKFRDQIEFIKFSRRKKM
jgi:hypothetical protein